MFERLIQTFPMIRWLAISGHTYGRPINGQFEIVGASYPDSSSYWKAQEGVYVKPNEKQKSNGHDEL